MKIWCLGNVLLGDDAVGCRVAELLNEKNKKNGKNFLDVTDCGTTPENHLASLRRQPPSAFLIVDAADMGLSPGEVRRLSIEELEAVATASHNIPISLLLSPFAGAFEITVLGIQPATTKLGAALSEAVENAARRVADLIERGEWDMVEKM